VSHQIQLFAISLYSGARLCGRNRRHSPLDRASGAASPAGNTSHDVKAPSLFKWADLCACISRRRGVVFLIFAGPRRAQTRPARSSHFPAKQPPWKKTAPAARPGAKVSAALPGAPPRDPRASADHPTWWLVPPDAHHGHREAKKRPSSAPGCSHQNQNPNQKTTGCCSVLYAKTFAPLDVKWGYWKKIQRRGGALEIGPGDAGQPPSQILQWVRVALPGPSFGLLGCIGPASHAQRNLEAENRLSRIRALSQHEATRATRFGELCCRPSSASGMFSSLSFGLRTKSLSVVGHYSISNAVWQYIQSHCQSWESTHSYFVLGAQGTAPAACPFACACAIYPLPSPARSRADL
jgi:hypothetical protein